jgi:hypothetical protein
LPEIKLPEEIEISIYNLFGQEVTIKETIPQNNMVSLNISNFPPGVYLAICRDSRKNFLKGRFIIY